MPTNTALFLVLFVIALGFLAVIFGIRVSRGMRHLRGEHDNETEDDLL
jgi:hypothetical protein